MKKIFRNTVVYFVTATILTILILPIVFACMGLLGGASILEGIIRLILILEIIPIGLVVIKIIGLSFASFIKERHANNDNCFVIFEKSKPKRIQQASAGELSIAKSNCGNLSLK